MTSEMRNICIKIYMPNLYNAVSGPVQQHKMYQPKYVKSVTFTRNYLQQNEGKH